MNSNNLQQASNQVTYVRIENIFWSHFLRQISLVIVPRVWIIFTPILIHISIPQPLTSARTEICQTTRTLGAAESGATDGTTPCLPTPTAGGQIPSPVSPATASATTMEEGVGTISCSSPRRWWEGVVSFNFHPLWWACGGAMGGGMGFTLPEPVSISNAPAWNSDSSNAVGKIVSKLIENISFPTPSFLFLFCYARCREIGEKTSLTL